MFHVRTRDDDDRTSVPAVSGKMDDILIEHADAVRGYCPTNTVELRTAVNAVKRIPDALVDMEGARDDQSCRRRTALSPALRIGALGSIIAWHALRCRAMPRSPWQRFDRRNVIVRAAWTFTHESCGAHEWRRTASRCEEADIYCTMEASTLLPNTPFEIVGRHDCRTPQFDYCRRLPICRMRTGMHHAILCLHRFLLTWRVRPGSIGFAATPDVWRGVIRRNAGWNNRRGGEF